MLLPVLLTLISLQGQDSTSQIDRIFSFASNTSPGCAVAVDRNGRTLVSNAYGMANLEYDVPLTPNTIFEAGSVSKQFTAAAVLLLQQDGKLSLEDPIAKYFPELPEYAKKISIRQMLNHTSGLRDWGAVMAVAGWPRGTRTYTHVHVLDIIAKQKSLNYEPGAEYLYSNSNYNLAAMLVERVSGMTFSDFTKTRLFQPLGMNSTSWRDDYTRIVKQRATAYGRAGTSWRQLMPFENVYGNSSLLTTVGDLTIWNRNFWKPAIGGADFTRQMETRGILNDKTTISYALGLVVDSSRGHPRVSHDGATAGYRASLMRYPEQGLSVALLCNTSTANPASLATQVSNFFLPAQLPTVGEAAASTTTSTRAALPSPESLRSRAGVYRDVRTGEPMRFAVRDSVIEFGRAGRIRPVSATTFEFRAGRVELTGPKSLRIVLTDGDMFDFVQEADWAPAPAELAQYAGTYTSDEAEATFKFEVKNGALTAVDRYGRSVPLVPYYKDGFVSAQNTIMVFRRDGSGKVNAVSFGLGRVRDLRFHKQ
jgi:CubicO group peptidase (beta-lactamase class C family)